MTSLPLALPETAPLEPTTPIKPSEAIRLGCLIAPVQVFEAFSEGEGTACAAGAANLGMGRAVDAYDWPLTWVKPLEALGDKGCPVFGCAGRGMIAHLNDDHRWSRERIADWLEGLGL